MAALGQTWTYGYVSGMSAFPLKRALNLAQLRSVLVTKNLLGVTIQMT